MEQRYALINILQPNKFPHLIAYFFEFLSQNHRASPPRVIPTPMPRSEEAEAFFAAVYQAVQEIPEARVTTYGHVAALIGRREFYHDQTYA